MMWPYFFVFIGTSILVMYILYKGSNVHEFFGSGPEIFQPDDYFTNIDNIRLEPVYRVMNLPTVFD